MKDIDTVVIPAAGLGTRGLPATKSVPKELLPVFDTPAIQFIVEEAASAGIKNVVLVVSSDKSLVVDYFDRKPLLESYLYKRGNQEQLDEVKRICSMVNIITVRQQKPLGLGHAVCCARPVVGNKPFAVILPDELLFSDKPGIKQLIDARQSENSKIVLGLMEVEEGEQGKYGIADIGSIRYNISRPVKVFGLVEKPNPAVAPSRWALTGRYVLPPEIFDKLDSMNGSFYEGEIQLTDAIADLVGILGFNPIGVPLEGKRFDLGNKIDYLCASIYFAFKKTGRPWEVDLAIHDVLEDVLGQVNNG